ncbi:MAG: type II toxin-antitoxin system VapC family toxin [Synergistaceae bacterium]|jgi:tRNA(fMet)-specific endonuclease VapC|nr:type II toxin-antitoxin system VapC family toxin [Synergistaceae bacterium]
MFLLDTNICIYAINRRSQKVIDCFSKKEPYEIKLSSVTLAELEYGASKSQNRGKNRMALFGFVAPFEIIPFDDRDAEAFGLIRTSLERQGRVIGPYDMQIAAQAISRDFTLVTNNAREFDRIPGLKIENWAA